MQKELQGKFLDGHTLELKISSHASSSSKTEKKLVGSKKTATKLMVRNVPFEATRTELLKLFGSFGQLKKVRLPKKIDGSHRGFAFVDYLSAEDAQNAMMKLSQTHLYGRHLVLEWSEDKDDMETLREKAKRDLQHQERSTTTNKKIRFE
jgi:multiple RNA-binding domain-containing protein 1